MTRICLILQFSANSSEKQKYYDDIISGITEGLGYRPIKFGINADTGGDENFILFDDGAEDQEYS